MPSYLYDLCDGKLHSVDVLATGGGNLCSFELESCLFKYLLPDG
jgi:hypothetical protein